MHKFHFLSIPPTCAHRERERERERERRERDGEREIWKFGISLWHLDFC